MESFLKTQQRRKINDRCLRRLHEADPDPLPRFRGPAREQQRVCAVSVPRPFHRDGDSGLRFVARHFLRMLVFSFAVFDFWPQFYSCSLSNQLTK